MTRPRFPLLSTLASLVLCTASAAHATTVSYTNFSSTAGLTLNGNAASSGNALLLTNTSYGGQAGSAWTTTKLGVVDGFDSKFSFYLGGGSGADGFAFVLQNAASASHALGGAGGGLGVQGMDNAVAVAFRSYAYNDIEIDACNTISVGCASASAGASLRNQTHTAEVKYAGNLLSVYLDAALIESATLNLSTLDGGTFLNGAYVGFTAGTGGANDNQSITSWDFSNTTKVPEPAPLALMGLGLAALAASRRKRA